MNYKLFLLLAFVAPLFLSAQGRIGQEPQNVGELISLFLQILGLLIPLIVTIALIAFLWGVFRYVIAKGPEDKKEAINVIAWGLIGLFVMVSVWGLVSVLSNTFGVRGGFPFFPTRGTSVGNTVNTNNYTNTYEPNIDEIPNPPYVPPPQQIDSQSP
ncbi:MAG: hypothetical protein HY455_02070 [Parcubacteria group bacterium]|nr:hypothetical protein [Parcubacteria group bacterium]